MNCWSGGKKVTIRPIRKEDKEIEAEFVRKLSSQSRYFRFLCGINELTPTMVDYFTEIDFSRDMALIATVSELGQEKEIAVGRYFQYSDSTACEFALVVADEWQGKGIGYQIMRDLIDDARRKKIPRMEGEIFRFNQGMLQMVRDLGFKIEPVTDDQKVVHAKLELTSIV